MPQALVAVRPQARQAPAVVVVRVAVDVARAVAVVQVLRPQPGKVRQQRPRQHRVVVPVDPRPAQPVVLADAATTRRPLGAAAIRTASGIAASRFLRMRTPHSRVA